MGFTPIVMGKAAFIPMREASFGLSGLFRLSQNLTVKQAYHSNRAKK